MILKIGYNCKFYIVSRNIISVTIKMYYILID